MLNDFKKNLKNNVEVYLRVKARPGAGKTEIKGVLDDETIKINIFAPPVKGKANKELINFLSKEFEVLKNNVKIISGAGERVKLVKIVIG